MAVATRLKDVIVRFHQRKKERGKASQFSQYDTSLTSLAHPQSDTTNEAMLS